LPAQLFSDNFETLTCRPRLAIKSADEAAAWAHWNLPAKNTLTAADAKIVEKQARLFTIGDARTADGTSDASTQLGLILNLSSFYQNNQNASISD
jgi:hypothetical protein